MYDLDVAFILDFCKILIVHFKNAEIHADSL